MSWLARPHMAVGPFYNNPLPGGTSDWLAIDPADAIASIVVRRSGLIEGVGNPSGSGFSHNWVTDAGTNPGDTHWVRFTLVSGDTPTGGVSLGVWHQINADRAITYTRTVVGALSGTFTIEISTSSGGSPIVAASSVGGYSMSATVDL